jgi:hypothetical protein
VIRALTLLGLCATNVGGVIFIHDGHNLLGELVIAITSFVVGVLMERWDR